MGRGGGRRIKMSQPTGLVSVNTQHLITWGKEPTHSTDLKTIPLITNGYMTHDWLLCVLSKGDFGVGVGSNHWQFVHSANFERQHKIKMYFFFMIVSLPHPYYALHSTMRGSIFCPYCTFLTLTSNHFSLKPVSASNTQQQYFRRCQLNRR